MTTDNNYSKLSDREAGILTDLVNAWNKAVAEMRYDLSQDDLNDFRFAIHLAQRIIVTRAAPWLGEITEAIRTA